MHKIFFHSWLKFIKKNKTSTVNYMNYYMCSCAVITRESEREVIVMCVLLNATGTNVSARVLEIKSMCVFHKNRKNYDSSRQQQQNIKYDFVFYRYPFYCFGHYLASNERLEIEENETE